MSSTTAKIKTTNCRGEIGKSTVTPRPKKIGIQIQPSSGKFPPQKKNV